MNPRTKALLHENNQAEKQLSAVSQQVMTDIVVYLRAAPLSLLQQETVRRDITRMLLDGEARGDDAQTVIGGDYRAFCDSVIAALPPLSGRARALTALRDTLPAAVVLLLIWLAGRAAEYPAGLAVWPALVVTAGDITGGVLLLAVASAAVTMICRTAFSAGRRTNRLLYILLFAGLFAALCASFFLKQALFTVHFLAAFLLPLALFAAYKLLDAKLD